MDGTYGGEFSTISTTTTLGPMSTVQSKKNVANATNGSTSSSVTNYKRDVKRDPSLFQRSKDMKYFDKWNRGTMSQARAHNVSEVLDPNFKPSNDEKKENFQPKNDSMYAVVHDKLPCDEGKTIVRVHPSDFDAQKVYTKLVDEAKLSVAATLELDNPIATQTGHSWRFTTCCSHA